MPLVIFLRETFGLISDIKIIECKKATFTSTVIVIAMNVFTICYTCILRLLQSNGIIPAHC